MSRHHRAAAVLASVAVLVSAGCSQTAALGPAGGGALAEVRIAALDVLVGADVDILTAPTCTSAPRTATISCHGATVDGRAITVHSAGPAHQDLDVEVGPRTIYRGSVQDVLDAAARSPS